MPGEGKLATSLVRRKTYVVIIFAQVASTHFCDPSLPRKSRRRLLLIHRKMTKVYLLNPRPILCHAPRTSSMSADSSACSSAWEDEAMWALIVRARAPGTAWFGKTIPAHWSLPHTPPPRDYHQCHDRHRSEHDRAGKREQRFMSEVSTIHSVGTAKVWFRGHFNLYLGRLQAVRLEWKYLCEAWVKTVTTN